MIKYGYKYGPRCIVYAAAAMGALEVLKNNSGRFVKADASKRLEIAGSGDADLVGWVLGGEFTTSATEGGTVLDVDISPNSVYLIPADAAVASTLLWEVCDLITTANIQMADIGEANEEALQIVGVDVDNQAVYVRLNPLKMYATTV